VLKQTLQITLLTACWLYDGGVSWCFVLTPSRRSLAATLALARYEQVEKDYALAPGPAKPYDPCIPMLMTRIRVYLQLKIKARQHIARGPYHILLPLSRLHGVLVLSQVLLIRSVFHPPFALPPTSSPRTSITSLSWIHHTPKPCPRIPRAQHFFRQSRGKMHTSLRNRLARSHSSTVSAAGYTLRLGRYPSILNPGSTTNAALRKASYLISLF
jgi:hypothetical protein